MTILMKKIIHVDSPDETEALGERVGRSLRGGEVIELISDVGGGKTTFVRGLARGAGSKDAVASPTFTLSRLYESRHLEIAHFDFYRLSEPELMQHELADHLGDDKTVLVIEWPDTVTAILPAKRAKIELSKTGESSRELTIDLPPELSYLLEKTS